MKRTLLRAILPLVAFTLVVVPAASGFDFQKIEQSISEDTLANGLRIIVMERHEAPVASFVTYANVGAVDDPKGYTGLAHMFEHMAFKGTTDIGTTDIKDELAAMHVSDSIFYLLRAERNKGMEADSTKLAQLTKAFNDAIDSAGTFVVPNAFDHILESNGAVRVNAGTGMDQTTYHMSLPSNRLELWMAMESARFKKPVLREMYRERKVIEEERRQTLENNPIRRALTILTETAFTAHPYGIPVIGFMSDIENYTRDEAKAFYAKYYVPSNLILAIVGDVNPKEVFALAQKYWGDIPYSPKPEGVATIEPQQKGERQAILEDPSQPFYCEGYHIPDHKNPDFPAIEAMMDYLGQGRTSLLYESLVKDKKIAADIGAFAGYPGEKYPCLALVYALPSPGHTNDECQTEIHTEIEKLQNQPLTAEDVEHIKARAKANFINGLTSNLGMAAQLASAENDWGDWHALFKQLDRINAVTAADIQRVAKKYFIKENRTVVFLNTAQS